MPLLQETHRSLRTYFLLVGALGTFSGVGGAVAPFGEVDLCGGIAVALMLALGLSFLVSGVLLRRGIREGWVEKILIGNGVVVVIRTLLTPVFFGQMDRTSLLVGGIGLLLTYYLYANVRRLARLERAAAPVTGVFE